MSDVACARCIALNRAPAVTCDSCNHILPFYTMNPFLIFQMRPTLTLDLAALDKIYFQLQRYLHPDKTSNFSEEEQEWAQAHIAQVNQAYKSIKQPLQAAKAAVLYFQDPKMPLESFNNNLIPTPDIQFLQLMMELTSAASTAAIGDMYTECLDKIDNAIVSADQHTILSAIARLTYVERLRKLR